MSSNPTALDNKPYFNKAPLAIFTIGHSTRSIDDFAAILLSHGVDLVVDVRTIPRSRHNPQYNSDALAAALHNHGIGYRHMPELGGLRHAKKDSVNAGWHNASFRGFADYMQTGEFRKGLEDLVAAAGTATAAIMCAEAVPWRCHRSLIADALLVRGITVREIMSAKSVREHTLTPWAAVDGENVTYPGKTDKNKEQNQSGEADSRRERD